MLVKNPKLFNQYIVGSPALWWSDYSLVEMLAGKSVLELEDEVHVFSFRGGNERERGQEIWQNFNQELVAKSNDLLQLEEVIIADEGHVGCVVIGLPQAIRYFYSRN